MGALSVGPRVKSLSSCVMNLDANRSSLAALQFQGAIEELVTNILHIEQSGKSAV